MDSNPQQNHHVYQTTNNHQHHHHHHHNNLPQQPSRPPSVDSVNLGSIYSGFYPQASSTGPSSLISSNIPPTMQNSYQLTGQYPSQSHPLQQIQQQGYHNYFNNEFNNNNNINNTWSLQQGNYQPTSQQPTSLPSNLSYHYQMSASAAAAAAAAAYGFNFSKQQQQQSQKNPNSALLVSPTNQSSIVTGLAPGSVQWPNNTGQTQSFTSAMTNHILSPTHLPQPQLPPMMAASGQTNFSQYYSQYYREYYQRVVDFYKHQQHVQNQAKIAPFKYNQFHSPCLFSQNNNQLIVVEPRSNVSLFGLQEVFTEKCYPNLFLQSLLYTNNNNVNDDPNATLLPFEDPQSSLDWIRVKQLNDSTMNYELKLILKVITMLFRQNETLSGLDLSELLYELIQPNNDDSEKLSQSGGSEVITKDYYRDLISHLRQLLMRGQRRVAITFAQNNGLFDHALTLSYLLSFLSSSKNLSSTNVGQIIDNNLMISTIKKFITTTLSTEDPLYVFYTHLIQIAINIQNSNTQENGTIISSPATGTSAKIDRLESLIILLANDIKFDKVEISDKSYRNLIDLMIALLKDDFNYILPDELFNNDRFDCLLVNECLEFARFRGKRLNPRLLIRKLEFAFELFDFGFVKNASRYLTLIEMKLKDPELDWKMMIDKRCKYTKWLLPESILNEEIEQVDTRLLQNIWSYQMSKIFNRLNREMKQFDSPLFVVKQKEFIGEDEEKTDNVDNNNEVDDIDLAVEEDEDRTDVPGDIEDEEADVELDTSESTFSKTEQYNRKQSPVSTSMSSTQQENLKQDNDLRNSTLMTNNTPVTDKTVPLNAQIMSPIEPITVDQSDNQINNQKSIPSQITSQQGIRRSLPNISNPSFPRTLNPIMEIPQKNDVLFESTEKQQKSSDSLDSPSLSQPNDKFNMSLLQSSLPSQNIENLSGKNSGNVRNHENVAPAFFQPPPLLTNENSQPFDFISTNGHVSSIPSYDPYLKNNEQSLDNQVSSNSQMNQKNNEFLQNTNNVQSMNNNFNETFKKPETINNANNNSNNNNGGESAKTSPSKSNNVGLLGAILGRLKPKNQMILPDDKDPQIIYDPVSKRWVDKSASDKGGLDTGMPPPPPKIPIPGISGDSSIGQNEPKQFPISPSLPSLQSAANNNSSDIPPMMMMNGRGSNPFVASIPPSSSSPNVGTANAFRSDLRRKRYVDVFNPTK